MALQWIDNGWIERTTPLVPRLRFRGSGTGGPDGGERSYTFGRSGSGHVTEMTSLLGGGWLQKSKVCVARRQAQVDHDRRPAHRVEHAAKDPDEGHDQSHHIGNQERKRDRP